MTRHCIIFLILGGLTFSACGDSDYDPTATPKESFTRVISKSYSPDQTRILTLKEKGYVGEKGYTQVFIEFERTGSDVYSLDTTGLDIKTYWVDNNHIVIETKKAYKGITKMNQVWSFGDKVEVEYIEH